MSPSEPMKNQSLAEDYERYAEPLTAGISEQALGKIGSLASGTSVVDIGAGTGAFALAAAAAGAQVLAIDYSSDMVERLGERLASFSECEARRMDGQALSIDDRTFDIAASFFGIITFPDWRQGLKEMVRVTKAGGQIVLATWPSANGAGATAIGVQAFRQIFPDRGMESGGPAPLGTEALLRTELQSAGCEDVQVWQIEQEWGGLPIDPMVVELEHSLELTPFYSQLDRHTKQLMRDPIRRLLAEHEAADGIVRISVLANVAMATVAP